MRGAGDGGDRRLPAPVRGRTAARAARRWASPMRGTATRRWRRLARAVARAAPTSRKPARWPTCGRGPRAPPFTVGRAASADAQLAARWRNAAHTMRRLRAVNPRIVPQPACREALASATEGDLAPFEQLLAALRKPFDDAPELARDAEPAPVEITARLPDLLRHLMQGPIQRLSLSKPTACKEPRYSFDRLRANGGCPHSISRYAL